VEGFRTKSCFNQSADSHRSRDCDLSALSTPLRTVKLIPNAELAVIPSASHFRPIIGTGEGDPIVKHFPGKGLRRAFRWQLLNWLSPGETR